MAKVEDPICHMIVDTDRARAKGVYRGETVYFCSEVCKSRYEAGQTR
ncbi:MAG: YHS domain-containing protein [Thermoplasmata archaeon]|jgi:YHS domain-containing protein|nr:YHS domain-containing protein [Thermoplasmata archaeon]MCI4341279.1 YHS domain-containing protein [Thermoplasmata archaeon]